MNSATTVKIEGELARFLSNIPPWGDVLDAIDNHIIDTIEALEYAEMVEFYSHLGIGVRTRNDIDDLFAEKPFMIALEAVRLDYRSSSSNLECGWDDGHGHLIIGSAERCVHLHRRNVSELIANMVHTSTKWDKVTGSITISMPEYMRHIETDIPDALSAFMEKEEARLYKEYEEQMQREYGAMAHIELDRMVKASIRDAELRRDTYED